MDRQDTPSQEGTSFVGIAAYLSGEAGWRSVAKGMELVLDLLRSHPKVLGHFEKIESKGRTEDRRIKELNTKEREALLRAIENGEIAGLHLRTKRVETVAMGTGHWFYCSLAHPSDAEERPRPEVGILGTFPLWMFQEKPDETCDVLLTFLRSLSESMPIIYSYVNLGLWRTRPGVAGVDRLYDDTAIDIPVSSFDDVFRPPYERFRRRVKGAFWLNILNPDHVDALGGIDRIREKVKAYSVEKVPNGRVTVRVTPSPISADAPDSREAYARLRHLLEPIIERRPEEPAILRDLRKAFEEKFLG